MNSELEKGESQGIKRVLEKPLHGLRVLVVDDELDACLMMSRFLAHKGAVVEIAGSVAQALQVLDTFTPDAVISDISMPGESGFDLLRSLKGIAGENGGKPRSIPAIAVTGYAMLEDYDRAIAEGFQAHISKPVNLKDLVSTDSACRLSCSGGQPKAPTR